MSFFNIYSFPIYAGVFGVVVAGIVLMVLQAVRVNTRMRVVLFLGVMLLYVLGVAGFNLSNHYPDTTVQTVAEVESTLTNGRPTFVTIYSNYCLGCMNALPAVRELQPELDSAGVNSLLLNIHAEPGSQLLDRFDARGTPTFILYDAEGQEVLRTNAVPSIDDIVAAVTS